MAEKYYVIKPPIAGPPHFYALLPADFYGNAGAGYTAYYYDAAPNGVSISVAVDTALNSNDTIITSYHSDQIFGGLGNDLLESRQDNDLVVGGSGDDTIYGSSGDDILYGDYANAPLIKGQTWSLPAAADLSLTGNDFISGGDNFDIIDGGPGNDHLSGDNGSDIILGGSGNDQIDGGPRGQGWTDDVSGGPGADLFLISYNEPGSPETESAYWNQFAASAAQQATSSFVSKTAWHRWAKRPGISRSARYRTTAASCLVRSARLAVSSAHRCWV